MLDMLDMIEVNLRFCVSLNITANRIYHSEYLIKNILIYL
jgi:hypothetical protein